MKKLVLILPLLLCGCTATNISKLATAIGKDQATWKVHVMTPYGSGDYTRIGHTDGQTVTVSPDGSISITTPPTNAVVSVQLVGGKKSPGQ